MRNITRGTAAVMQAKERAELEGPAGFPLNHVVAIVDAAPSAETAVTELLSGGFLTSEVHVATGGAAAESLHKRRGHAWLTGLVVRFAEWLGVRDEEMELKAAYERALRENRYMVLVAAPTPERRERAVRMLRKYGAHTVNYLRRFTTLEIVPPGHPS